MLLQFWITVFYIKIILNVIYSCNGKAEFSASLLQSSESYDPSEIIMLLNIFLKSVFFRILWTESKKEQLLYFKYSITFKKKKSYWS